MGKITRKGARLAALTAAALLLTPLEVPAFSAPQDAASIKLDQSPKQYIVQLDAAPLAAYKGGLDSLAPTAPKAGQKVDTTSSSARAYSKYLESSQATTMKAVGLASSALTRSYKVAFNGYAAKMTPQQASALGKVKGVARVWEDEVRYADTVSTPSYLGVSGDKGLWATKFAGQANAGKGIVVGVIDTGIDPDNPSFAAIPGGAAAPERFSCNTGSDTAFTCTNKIVGARFYGSAYGNNVQYDHNSPRDTNGHGSHTAGTAAGNYGVAMSISGIPQGEGSGMAPAAQIAVYKGLWQTSDGRGSGSNSGLVAAIDDAVADGVDIINYSVSGSSTFVVGPDELAFMTAAQSGIFVSASAGNSGDTVGVSSVAHNAPWTMTVAASTHDRSSDKTVTLGNNAVYNGVGVGPAVGPAPMILASAIALPGVSAQAARECWLDADTATAGQQPALDPAMAAGHIVICDRGTVARVDKSAAVKIAGGIGMIQTNTSDAQSLNADFHSVPSIHVNATSGAAIKAFMATQGTHTATISAKSTDPVDAPSMAGFSSYGPALAGEGDLLKPDITAPGVDVIAPYSADDEGTARFDSLSGTSMSAPHIAGLGALMKQKFPNWSPMAIKSAMMTTARQTTTADKPIQWAQGDATPLNFGSGEVMPGKAYNPGLVYDSKVADWLVYACGIGQLQLIGADCAGMAQKDPSDLNYPSISIGKLAGSQKVTRTVTNVSGKSATYTAKVDAPAGVDVTVSPEKLTLVDGASATFTVTLTANSSAVYGKYTFGALTWVPADSAMNAVRSPLAMIPTLVAAPQEVFGEGATGSADVKVTGGFTGDLAERVNGLIPATVTPVNVVRDPASTVDGATFLDVAAGTKHLRVSTFGDEVAAGDIDLALLYRNPATGKFAAVGSSATDGSSEQIDLANPPAGTYAVAIDLYSSEANVNVPLNTWAVPATDAGNLTMTPSPLPVTIGKEVVAKAAWNGIDTTKRYLGVVEFVRGDVVGARTLVNLSPILPFTNVGTPVIEGNPWPGQVVTANEGTWQPTPDAFSYKWYRVDGTTATAIEGATAKTYTVTQADVGKKLRVEVTGTKPGRTTATKASGDVAVTASGRIFGIDRYETSAMLALAAGKEGGMVFIATGLDFPDALGASASAAKQGGTLMMVEPNNIPAPVAAALAKLKPSKIVVLGGEKVISPAVYTKLGTLTPKIERIAGIDRFATAVAVSQMAFPDGADSVIITDGTNFPDALSAGSLFGSKLGPVLLADGPSTLDEKIMKEVIRLRPAKAYILGGTGAVSPTSEAQLRAAGVDPVRLAGPDRYATSLAIAKFAFPKTASTVYFTTGTNFPDGMALGPLAANKPGPVLLTNGQCLPKDVADYAKSLGASSFVGLGGPLTVSDDVLKLKAC